MDLVRWNRSLSRAWIAMGIAALYVLSGCGKSENKPTPSPLSPAAEYLAPELQTEALWGGSAQVAALWESAQPKAGKAWTDFAFQTVQTYGTSLMAGSQDVVQFCPSYQSLTADQKASFWVYLVSAITKYESDFDPTSRMREPGMGNDPITHQPVYSEGLLQLSYQDSQAYSFCNEFDWSADRVLSPKDPRKTILDPFKNLRCGIRILDHLVARHHLIAFGNGNYWSTLMPNGSHGKVSSIKALTHQIAFCR